MSEDSACGGRVADELDWGGLVASGLAVNELVRRRFAR